MTLVSAVCLLVIGAVGVNSVMRLNAALSETNSDTIPSIGALDDMEFAILKLRTSVLNNILNNDDPAARKRSEERIAEGRVQLAKLQKNYEKLVFDAEDRELLDNDAKGIAVFLDAVGQVLEKSAQNDDVGARAVNSKVLKPAADKLVETLEVHSHHNEKSANDNAVAGSSLGKSAIVISVSAVILGILLVGAIGFVISRAIRRSLDGACETMLRVERDNDFTLRATVFAEDEVGTLATTFNRLLDKMQRNLKTISDRAGQVAVAASHMAATSSQVAAASSSQSASASDMAASIEEMTVSISHVGERASEANHLSGRSGEMADSGGRVIKQTVADINDIAGSVNVASERIRALESQSDNISSVVSTIREVAEQTNLLALNAAIEAARAGEQGRGFAVVADEVRKLAERTAASTREIALMVDTIRTSAKDAVGSMEHAVTRVTDGVARAADASEAVTRIGDSSRHVVDMVGEITTAIREQSSASTSIAQQVERIAQMAEESNAAASESAQSARELDTFAASMQEIVRSYRL
jgi:methyl-accepting chemotaxis protein